VGDAQIFLDIEKGSHRTPDARFGSAGGGTDFAFLLIAAATSGDDHGMF